MPTWDSVTIGSCLEPLHLPAEKVQAKDYLTEGTFPIVDQGQTLIAGWTNNSAGLIEEHIPVVVFGDHTRAIKFIDFPFVRGADGTQILHPDNRFDVSFFYFACKSVEIEGRGYNRHFSILKEMEIPIPPKDEQEKIGTVLTHIESLIKAEDHAINATSALKRAAMRELFTRGLRGEPQKETEIGLVPESWEVVKLERLCSIRHGYAFQGHFFKPCGEYILLTPGHFIEEGGFRDQNQKTKFYVGKIPEGYILEENDLLVAMTEQKPGLLGSTLLVPDSHKYLHNQRLGLVTILKDDHLEKKYLYHLFNTHRIRDLIAANASGSKVRHTSPSKVLSIPIPLPSPTEQAEIVEILDAIDRKIDLHKRKKALLEELFKSLLHKLMTGEIRVEDLDVAALEGAE